ncbi:heavy-metal-associated domain-containing protein [Streptomyces vilmorinianum]|uniref:heavy-metal-associated domain-containing protein n=1 Tax=Streptomyces vilmorinianum TaxID=3051092 RepID=UPI0020C7B53A|nr:heavy metal-associated domain-containing protein [Streptomyces vilmorinianum]
MRLFGGRKKREAVTGAVVVLEIDGMHCTSCGLLIDDELEEIPGVRSARTDVRGGRSTVRFEEGAEVDTDVLAAAVRRAGEYEARPVG